MPVVDAAAAAVSLAILAVTLQEDWLSGTLRMRLSSVTVDTRGLAQKLPAGQSAQVTLAVITHALTKYWPAEHTPHVVQTEALDTEEYVIPAEQAEHIAFADEVQYDET